MNFYFGKNNPLYAIFVTLLMLCFLSFIPSDIKIVVSSHCCLTIGLMSRDDLKLHPDIKPLKMHCRKCYLEIEATNFEVWESERLGVKKIIEETPIDQLYDVCEKLTSY